MKSDLSKVKPGDYIWTSRNGYEKVRQNKYTGTACPILLSNDHSFTIEGKRYVEDKYPSAFLVNPFDENDLPPVVFKKGEIVAVRESLSLPWVFRKFVTIGVGGHPRNICENGTGNGLTTSWECARKLTDKERGLCD